jgi:two-component system cell cycle response regulator DivK
MRKTILLVEDNEANRTLVRDILTHHGYEVLVAVNGEEGVRLAMELIPDLIIMDIQMPVMNGFTAIAYLKKNPQTHAIKILAITSFAMAGDRERVMASGADGYLSKPINTRELPPLVAGLLGT